MLYQLKHYYPLVSLEINVRFEIGGKLAKTSESRWSFFRRGFSNASLKDSGTTAERIDWLILVVITGKSTEMHCFWTEAGTGSKGHDLIVDLLISCEISEDVADLKLDIVNWSEKDTLWSESKILSNTSSSALRMTAILSYLIYLITEKVNKRICMNS